MRGQSGLISTMIMVGAVLIIGIAALSYYNSSMTAQRSELQLQSMLALESSRTVTGIVYGNGTDFVVFLSKKEVGANLAVLVLGSSENDVRYQWLGMGLGYELYVADSTNGAPYYNISDLGGWSEAPSLIKDAREIYVKGFQGTTPYIRLSDMCRNLPPGGGVSVGVIRVEADEPVLLRVHLAQGLDIDYAWVIVLMDVGGTYYQIATVYLPYHT